MEFGLAIAAVIIAVIILWQFYNNSSISEAARSIAQEFQAGDIVRQDIDPHGISSLTVRWRAIDVTARWFGRTGSPCDITFGDNRFGVPKGDGDFIIRAAKTRGKHLINEKLKNLSRAGGVQ